MNVYSSFNHLALLNQTSLWPTGYNFKPSLLCTIGLGFIFPFLQHNFLPKLFDNLTRIIFGFSWHLSLALPIYLPAIHLNVCLPLCVQPIIHASCWQQWTNTALQLTITSGSPVWHKSINHHSDYSLTKWKSTWPQNYFSTFSSLSIRRLQVSAKIVRYFIEVENMMTKMS